MKSILFVFPSISAGGAERNAISLANHLIVEYDYRITFLILNSSVDYKEFIDKRIEIFQLNIDYEKLNRLARIFTTYIFWGYKIFKYSRKRSYDFIIGIHEFDPEIAMAVSFLLYRISISHPIPAFICVLQITSGIYLVQNSKLRRRIIFPLIRKLRPFIYKDIIAVTRAIAGEVKKGRVIVIPNSIDVKKIENESMLGAGADLKTPYLINIGRISIQKNQILLLEAFKSVHKIVPHNLYILGRIQEEILYYKLVNFIEQNNLANRIKFLGVVQNPFPIIKNATALILVSKFEGMPLVLLEAMSLMTLVISTKYSGYDEILNNKNSLIVENREELIAAILNAAERRIDPDLIKHAYNTVKDYDIKNVCKKYHKIFNNQYR